MAGCVWYNTHILPGDGSDEPKHLAFVIWRWGVACRGILRISVIQHCLLCWRYYRHAVRQICNVHYVRPVFKTHIIWMIFCWSWKGPCRDLAVSHEGLKAEIRFHSHSGPRGVCGWQSDTATGFSVTTSVFAFYYIIPPVLPTLPSICHWHSIIFAVDSVVKIRHLKRSRWKVTA